jgi:hypothetical protein
VYKEEAKAKAKEIPVFQERKLSRVLFVDQDHYLK